ncbi:hypothetical protein QJS66_22130 [Kocuria rhizophila]|nr:hypothetical protein QJS66_22130 [Kocuria rhizophila]
MGKGRIRAGPCGQAALVADHEEDVRRAWTILPALAARCDRVPVGPWRAAITAIGSSGMEPAWLDGAGDLPARSAQEVVGVGPGPRAPIPSSAAARVGVVGRERGAWR